MPRKKAKKKPKKFYVVWEGFDVGIVTTWKKCQELVVGYSESRFMSFKTLEEAEEAFENYNERHMIKSGQIQPRGLKVTKRNQRTK